MKTNELRAEILKLLAEMNPGPDPAAQSRPHLSIEAAEVISVVGQLRQGAGRGMVLFHVGNFPSVRSRPVKDVLEELVKDGYFKDQVRVVCPEGHTIELISRAIAEIVAERCCRQCGRWLERADLSFQTPFILADHLHLPQSRGRHVLLAEAEGLLTRAAEALDAPR